MSYKKRGKAGWVSGKEAKENIKKERMYSREEIRDIMKEEYEGEDFRYQHQSKKKPNKEEKIIKQLNWYELTAEKWGRSRFSNIFDSRWFNSGIAKCKKQLKKIRDKKDEKN